jgi:hypothetical protein
LLLIAWGTEDHTQKSLSKTAAPRRSFFGDFSGDFSGDFCGDAREVAELLRGKSRVPACG